MAAVVGYLNVTALSDTTPLSNVAVTVDGQSGMTPVTFTLPVGTYSITATYQGITLPPQAVTITDGGTTSITLQFGAALFSDDFESGNLSKWTGTWDTAPTITTVAHRGNYGAKIVYPAGYSDSTIYYTFSTPRDSVSVRAHAQIPDLTQLTDGAHASLIAAHVSAAYGTPNYGVFYAGLCRTGGVVKWFMIYRAPGYWAWAYSDIPVTSGWHSIEVRHVTGNGNGEDRVYIDGTEIITLTNLVNNDRGPVGGVQAFGWSEGGTTPIEVYLDDFVASDSYIGPEPETGFLSVEAFSGTTSIAASVSIDGQSGTTPTTFAFSSGTYSVTASYQGITLPAQTVTIVAGQTSTITLHFSTAAHTVTFSSVPSGVSYTNPAGTAPFQLTVNDGDTVTVQVPNEIVV